ncbi:MAG: phosphonoacetaldehyde reductase [Rubrivivax sp.]|nr:phosphonoacetaldehyde reductase [Rubrivivax sp.]
MKSAFAWHMPVELRFGAGCSAELSRELGARSAVVLAFEHATALGLDLPWLAALGDRLLDWVPVADGLSSIARARVLAGRVWPLLAARPGCVIVAVGGGTTLDLAKVLRCRPADGRFDSLAAALRGSAPWPALDLAPLWLLPTTAGTGSEVTRWATVWDTEAEPAVKRSLDEPWGYAQRAYIDPALTLSCPAAVTRDTALDTLAHALEALWNRHANPMSDRLAVSAARRVLATLPTCLRQPHELSLRTELSLAALEAGLAFSQTRTALAHALSYAVTLEQDVPHGLACAIWLPTAWQLALGHDARVDARLSEVFAIDARQGRIRLQAWLKDLGVDAKPQAFGIGDADARVQAALTSPRGRNFVGALNTA